MRYPLSSLARAAAAALFGGGLALAASLSPPAASAQAAVTQDEASKALADIARGRAALKTLQVSFTQERELSLLSSKVTSRGELLLARPNKMRWHLGAPDDATYWVSAEGVSYRTKDGVGSVSAGQAAGLQGLLADLLIAVGGDLDKIKTRYDLTAKREDDKVLLTLMPKTEKTKKLVKRLLVTVDADGTPRRVVLEEPEGDSTVIVFGEAKKNQPIPDSALAPPSK